jgi:hypothetical protein
MATLWKQWSATLDDAKMRKSQELSRQSTRSHIRALPVREKPGHRSSSWFLLKKYLVN